jgi:uncharacterized damage-inducible protein DinB
VSQPGNLPEPWLRGTLSDVPAVQRAVLHALQSAEEDLAKWCSGLTDGELHSRPAGLAPVAFQLRHIAGSVDRLLTYAEGRELTADQMQFLKSESSAGSTVCGALGEFSESMKVAADRVRRFTPDELELPRGVGRKHLPTTVGGLLVHVADHTQRHVGQAIITAKLLLANRTAQQETRE